MPTLKRTSLSVLLLASTIFARSQQTPAVIDSLKKKLSKTTDINERSDLLGALSRIYMNTNLAIADSLGKQMIEEAENSRDRHLIVEALLTNGDRNSYFASQKEKVNKAIAYYQQALQVARDNKLDKDIARSYLALSAIYRSIPDAEKAFNYCNQAFSYISMLDNDSLKVQGYLEYGAVYNVKREKLLALRNYLAGLKVAEEMKNIRLMRDCYGSLTNFYSSVGDYDKAIDYQVKALALLDKLKDGQVKYNKVVFQNAVGNLYAQKKNYDMANSWFERAIRTADSIHYEPLKMPAYMGILNNYLSSNRPAEALDYFNKNTEVKQFITNLGMGSSIDMAYGYIYTELGSYDSAAYYYNKSAPFFENNSNQASRYSYYFRVGRLNELSGKMPKAIEYFTRAKEVAYSIGDPERIRDVAQQLDSVYTKAGDFRQAREYNALFYQYKDSLENLGKEKDLLQVEAADIQQRETRIAKEEAEKKRIRNYNQYIAITIGIAVLFVLLVLLGMFKVSAGTIRAIGFFAFLIFFEFIFLMFKKNIYSITHGEPWKDLAFMIGLAALLVPLHHWLEEKVLHYLTSHNLLTAAGKHIKTKFFSKPGTTGE
ncbi:MAG TPA: tetratricopeptide repeat protein [Chitinophagaceae bacterium]|nr:tetratricopeptide repeat protein [Chitinophagaceae bacterium]